MNHKDKLQEALFRVAGKSESKQVGILMHYSEFLNRENGEVISAVSVQKMSNEWARVTLEKLLDAVKSGIERFRFDSTGNPLPEKKK